MDGGVKMRTLSYYTPRPNGLIAMTVIPNNEVETYTQIRLENVTPCEEGYTPSIGDRVYKSTTVFNYYPPIVKDITENKAIAVVSSDELNEINQAVEKFKLDSFLNTMGIERCAEWETALGIIPSSNATLEDRRSTVLARFRSTNKLNESIIKAMVKAFTGGEALVSFRDSTITVKIEPPDRSNFSFTDLTNELVKRKPAHLNMNVTLNYATWKDVSEDFGTWRDVYQLENWEAVKLYKP